MPKKKQLNRTLKKRRAICGGYSELYKVLAQAAGLDCEVIGGYSKTDKRHIGKKQKADHAWNVVKIEGMWKLLDVTWASSYIKTKNIHGLKGDPYFFTDPILFKYNHLPEEKYWQLSDPITNDEFFKYPLPELGFFNNNYRLAEESKVGTIEVFQNETFKIRFKNTGFEKRVHYSTKKEKFYKLLSEEDGYLIFTHTFDKSGVYYLTIYDGFLPSLTYRVIVKKPLLN